MASFCMERLLFVKKFTLYFRRLNFFLWSIVIVLLLQQVHCQKPPVYTAESCSNESVFCFFSTKSEQTAIQQSHIINPLLTSFARSVRESIAFGFYRTDLAPSSLGLYENLRQYFPVQTSHSVNKSLLTSFARSVRESIAFGFYRTDLAPSSLGLYENLRQYFPVQTSHSVNKSLIYQAIAFCTIFRIWNKIRTFCVCVLYCPQVSYMS